MTENKLEKECCSSNLKTLRVIAKRISFLMPHQVVLPDLQELAATLDPKELNHESTINREFPEYLLGAYEALAALISYLEEKDQKPRIR